MNKINPGWCPSCGLHLGYHQHAPLCATVPWPQRWLRRLGNALHRFTVRWCFEDGCPCDRRS